MNKVKRQAIIDIAKTFKTTQKQIKNYFKLSNLIEKNLKEEKEIYKYKNHDFLQQNHFLQKFN